jgi:hypothetical protein
MKIQVTQHDILYGERGIGCECPVARAVRRTTKRDAYVNLSSIALVKQNTILYEYFKVPKTVKAFIRKFDGNQAVEPFYFFLKGV